jgi:hypothetical protein
LFGLTPSDGFLYLQITLELEPISKMWITISGWPVEPVGPVEPVEIGKMYDFIFPRANGLTGQPAQPKSYASKASTAATREL